ncbi:MAG TPA: glucoamylase family protein, partial [Gemmatimonadales bacterium]|nr:glucoamylase family protein [Gemmatimonadales bacterium]
MGRLLPVGAPRRASIEEPIRSELFGIERLEEHAESLASAQPVTAGTEAGHRLLERVEDNGRVLREANRTIGTALQEKHWITPAAEWLVDNFFVVDEQLREIRKDLPAGYYRELPKLADGPLTDYPRVYGIAWAFVAHTDSHFDPDTLRRFVRAYQRVQPLTIGELWAVPITLRVVLVENLRRMADVVIRRRQAQQEANAFADAVVARGGQGADAWSTMLARDEGARLATAFAVELVQRLRDQDPAATPALAWLHHRLAAQGTTPDEITLVEHQRQAATTVTVRNIITSMRLISAVDWTTFFEGVSLVDEALRAGSDFAAMDFVSRDSYRHAIEDLARGSERSELDIAREALAHGARNRAIPRAEGAAPDARAADPGFHLIGNGRRDFERAVGYRPRLGLRLRRAFIDAATWGYLGTLLLFTILILAVPLVPAGLSGLSITGLLVLGLLALIPASDLAVALLNRGVTMVVTPALLPRLEWPKGVPAEFRTMVAIPALLTSPTEVEELVERLEVHYLANSEGDVCFALVSDWSDAPAERAPADDEILAAARDGIARLNALHGPAPGGDRFFVFHRRRCWNESEGVWMGWERKRGKLHELNRLLRGATDTTFLATAGTLPGDVRYVVTVDADTRLPIGAVKRLAGTMAHPLNRPRLDPATQRVVEGYAVLQPRVTPPLPGVTGSIFQRLASGPSGVDPYAAAVSDVYQDLFGEGSYTGKGIYDIEAFEAALAGRVPENSLLSHDLFEGLLARAGLVTDVELFESAPVSYLANAARQHRWARGDWQLLPWILRHRLSPVGRWKMIDNLRRSASMPAAFLTLVAGWAWPGASAAAWTAFVLTVIALPPLLPVLSGLPSRSTGVSRRRHFRAVARDFRSAMAQMGLSLTMMAHQAWLMTDAIARTLGRLLLTHRRMLEWKTMARATSGVPVTRRGFYRCMAGGLFLALAGAVLVAWSRPGALRIAAPVFLLWGLAPGIARWVSVPGRVSGPEALPSDGPRTLRLIARRTWRYFTTFVTAESRWLPPDNFQETPRPLVAQRTSPTNIGLYLLSAVSARDFGWIGTLDLADRLEATLRAVRDLEHYRGHLFNWYDSRNGEPLEPRYVSSVDSGNLAGALLTLSNACREIIEQAVPVPRGLSGIEDAVLLLRESADPADQRGNAGVDKQRRLDDALDVVMTVLAQEPASPTGWAQRLAELETAARVAADRARDLSEDLGETSQSALIEAAKELRAAVTTLARDADTLMPWARLRVGGAVVPPMGLATTFSLAELPQRCGAALRDVAARRAAMAPVDATPAGLREIDALAASLEHSAAAATELVQRLDRIADEARAMAMGMDFRFLFDSTRMLFAIGYRMTDGELDPGRYDLLASEARLLSFLAIAKGDVPAKHWFRLGRSLTPVGKEAALLSWSGSMFEYLMPRLIMRAAVGSILEQSCRLVVERQIEYGEERGVPWGMSESGYHVRDVSMIFQYSSFGVPGLGLRRRLGDDVVIAPYATGLAVMVQPREALRNFQALTDAGAAGRYGYYESLDYTASRLPVGTMPAVVRMYMAHHQGMVIVAIANALHGGAMRARFHREPIVRASELLLQERTPRDVALVPPQVDTAAVVGDVRELVPLHTRTFSTPHGATPRTHLLSNGRYTVMLTAAGSGYSRWRDLAITRWREDATRDDSGSYILLRDTASGERWSAGFQPSGTQPESYKVSFSEDRAEFIRHDGAITTRLEVIVSSEDDAEVRRVSITNHGARAREIEVTSYAEIVLAPPTADAAHPAFSNLFVQTESIRERSTLLATRRPRSAEEAAVWLAHVLTVEG